MHSFQPSPSHLPAIQRWLMLCITLVVLMVAVGGVTRLTESGLSIVEWKLVSGTFPPMNDTAWNTEFDEYKTSPQFQKVNQGFALDDFKDIFWLEYLHRVLGRIIGLVILGGTLYFGVRKRFTRALTIRMIAISVLVGAQGTVGWVMVASGLNNEPRVEPIKLGLHLLLAFSLFAALIWTRWQVLGHPRSLVHQRLAITSRMLLCLVILQIFFGALVAGLRAGLSYNTYPLMDGTLLPDGLYLLTPWWKNHFESVLMVQFQHRMGALLVVACVLAFTAYAQKILMDRTPLKWLLSTVFAQFLLGVLTLLTVVDLWLASTHQLVALLLFGILIRLVYLTPLDTNQRPPKIRT